MVGVTLMGDSSILPAHKPANIDGLKTTESLN